MRVAWVSPAWGKGGGHLSRFLAITRAAERAAFPVDWALFTGTAGIDPRVRDAVPSLTHEPASLDARAHARGDEAFRNALHRSAPDLVLVDLVWMPVQPLLRELALPGWLLLRWVPPAWLVGPRARPFQRCVWDRVWTIEPFRDSTPELPLEAIGPFVTTNPDELRPAADLRERLGVAPDERLILVPQTGAAGESEVLAAAVERGQRDRVVRLHAGDAHGLVPLAPWLAGADRIVAGAGYNLTWEVRWLGLEERTRLVPFPRNNDDQAWRAACAWRPTRNGADELIGAMRRGG